MRNLTNLTPPSWFAVALSISIHLVDLFHLCYEGSLRHLKHKIFVKYFATEKPLWQTCDSFFFFFSVGRTDFRRAFVYATW